MTEVATLRRVLDAIRASVAHGREPLELGPFTLWREPRGGALANYALPREGAAPSAAELRELIEAFAVRRLPARMEYLPALAPEVEPAALRCGFEVELRTPLMVLGETPPAPSPDGVTLELVTPESADEAITGLGRAQNEAFAGDPGSVDCAAWRARHAGIWMLARVDGEPAGGGVVTKPHRGAAEVAGIGVRPRFRRRGIAAALTTELSRRARDAGLELLFLTPGGEEAQRIYARAGYEPAGEALHLRSTSPATQRR